jgi:hypothetical protein
MKSMILSAAALTLAAVTACAEPATSSASAPAVKGLQGLKWGMSAAQVVKTLSGNAKVFTGKDTNSFIGSAGLLGATSVEVVEGKPMPIDFYFTRQNRGLVEFDIKVPGGYQPCEALRATLDARHGRPFFTSGGAGHTWKGSQWYVPSLPGQVELLSIGDDGEALCHLSYMDEMGAGARDAKGLTRNEGKATPRPDYKPYRPAN